MMRVDLARRRLAKSSTGMAEFLANLELRITIAPAQSSQLARVAQLTWRTNQFNFTTRRRSPAELEQLGGQGWHSLAVEVGDRFGDYGLVGVVIYSVSADALVLDTFLLSCRVLGRGVEHAVLRELGKIASDCRKLRLEMSFFPTARNLPARRFLDSLGAEVHEGQDGGMWFSLAAEKALSCLPALAGDAATVPGGAAEVNPGEPGGGDAIGKSPRAGVGRRGRR